MAFKLLLLTSACLALVAFTDCQHLKFIPATTHNSTSGNTSATTTSSDTTTAPNTTASGWQGYVGAIVAVIFFGSNYLPVKKFETGDGMFFQWVFCVAIWIGGWIANWVLEFPKFHALAMLGGFLWATGNVCVVPVIKTIGIGLGMLIWGSFNLLSGWASGRFGWFGLHKEIPSRPNLNYAAIALAMTSAIVWMFVKSQPNQPIELDDEEDDDQPALLSDEYSNEKIEEGRSMVCTRVAEKDSRLSNANINDDVAWENKLSANKRRALGISLSVVSGTLYGLAFAPVIYIKNNFHGSSQHDVDYVFAHFSGILVTSTVYFVIYCALKRNKPLVYPSAILPALASGGMWAAADIGWFIANNYLSEAVSFPIVTTGPGIIASLWGIFLFKEVKGGCGQRPTSDGLLPTITSARPSASPSSPQARGLLRHYGAFFFSKKLSHVINPVAGSMGHRNYLIMALAYALTIAGAVLAGLSKT